MKFVETCGCGDSTRLRKQVDRAINKAVESLVFCIFVVAVFAVGRYYDAIPRGIAYGLSIAVFGVGAMSIAMLRQVTKSL